MAARKLLIWSGAVVGALALAGGVVAMSTGLVHSGGKASAVVATDTPWPTPTHSPSASPSISVSTSPSSSPALLEPEIASPAPVETKPPAPVQTTPPAPVETKPPAPVTSAITNAIAAMTQAGGGGYLPYVITAEVRLAPGATLRCWVDIGGMVFESNEMVLESWIGDGHPMTALGDVTLEPADYPFTAHCTTSDGVTWSQSGTAYHDQFVGF